MCVCVCVVLKRPNLSHDLMKDSEDEEESEEDEEDEEIVNKKNAMQQKLQKFSEDDDIHEELITDGKHCWYMLTVWRAAGLRGT